MLVNYNNFPNIVKSISKSIHLNRYSSAGKARVFHLNLSICWFINKIYSRPPLTIKRALRKIY